MRWGRSPGQRASSRDTRSRTTEQPLLRRPREAEQGQPGPGSGARDRAPSAPVHLRAGSVWASLSHTGLSTKHPGVIVCSAGQGVRGPRGRYVRCHQLPWGSCWLVVGGARAGPGGCSPCCRITLRSFHDVRGREGFASSEVPVYPPPPCRSGALFPLCFSDRRGSAPARGACWLPSEHRRPFTETLGAILTPAGQSALSTLSARGPSRRPFGRAPAWRTGLGFHGLRGSHPGGH